MKDMGVAATARHMDNFACEANKNKASFRALFDRAAKQAPNIVDAALRLCAMFEADTSREGPDGSSMLLGVVYAFYMLERAETEPDEIDNLAVTIVPTERPR